MRPSRRQVLQWIAATAGGTAALPAMRALAQTLAAGRQAPLAIWFNEGGTDHNLLAQLGRIAPDFLNLVAVQVRLEQFTGLLPAGVPTPVPALPGSPVLILEALPDPEEDSPRAGQVLDWMQQAKAVLLLGTDACYGGLRHTPETVRRYEAVAREAGTPLIKLPGVPVPPQHLLGTLAYLEYQGFPQLDAQRRPRLYYGETVCTRCEWRGHLERGEFAAAPGTPGCLLRLGCKGTVTHNSCARLRWNEGANWCVGAGGPCTGCSEPGFPQHAGLGLYGQTPGDGLGGHLSGLRALHWLGAGALALTAAGAGLRIARQWLRPDPHTDGT